MNATRALVLGFGYWGSIVSRAISSLDGVSLDVIVELDDAKRHLASRQFPNARVISDLSDIGPAEVDFGYIGTPPNLHVEYALRLLKLGINVVVAKPLSLSVEDDLRLEQCAKESGLKIFCDYTYLFTPAVQAIKKIVSSGQIGTPLFYTSNRTNLGLIRSDSNVVWDLASHDFAIFQFLFETKIKVISSRGSISKPSKLVSTASISFSNSGVNQVFGSVFVSWFSAEKVRNIVIAGSEGSIVFNDAVPSEKLFLIEGRVIYESSDQTELGRIVEYRIGEKQLIELETEEALKIEFKQIAESISGSAQTETLIDTKSIAMHTTEVCVAADKSMNSKGLEVKVGEL
jgi:predicted dehydrogenase